MTLPIRKTMCATCPFREGSKYAYLKEQLAESAKTEASRICHSTGSDNAIYKRTGKPPHICRGARDEQLKHFTGKIISEPTDEAWEKACELFGIEPPEVKDP